MGAVYGVRQLAAALAEPACRRQPLEASFQPGKREQAPALHTGDFDATLALVENQAFLE
jgi:hypothetical protein